MDYPTILHIAADSPAALRRSDVFRVLEAAHTAGCLEGFCAWLSQHRPEFLEEILDCRNDL